MKSDIDVISEIEDQGRRRVSEPEPQRVHRDTPTVLRGGEIPRHSYLLKKEVLLVKTQTHRMVWIDFI